MNYIKRIVIALETIAKAMESNKPHTIKPVNTGLKGINLGYEYIAECQEIAKVYKARNMKEMCKNAQISNGGGISRAIRTGLPIKSRKTGLSYKISKHPINN